MKRITPIYIVEMKSLEWDDAAWNIIVAYDNEIDALALLESDTATCDTATRTLTTTASDTPTCWRPSDKIHSTGGVRNGHPPLFYGATAGNACVHRRFQRFPLSESWQICTRVTSRVLAAWRLSAHDTTDRREAKQNSGTRTSRRGSAPRRPKIQTPEMRHTRNSDIQTNDTKPKEKMTHLLHK